LALKGEKTVDPETEPVEEKASEHVSVELPANLVNKAREAGIDVEAVCRTAVSTAVGFKNNWMAMQRAGRSVIDEVAGRFKR
jgi:post-segregation antitoxin (ccd killing protein)